MTPHRRLIALGVGPGWPCPSRNGSCFLYDWNGARWLCDCGEPATRQLKAAGVPLASIDAILLTHLHFDHVGGLFMFLQGCWVEQRQRPLTICLPGHGIPAIREMLRQGFIFDALLPFPIEWRDWETAPLNELAGVRIQSHPTTHLDSLRRQYPDQMPSAAAAYALAFEGAGARVVHSGDVGHPADLAPLLDSPPDLLVCELAHFEPVDLFRFLANHPPRELLLVHLANEFWANRETIRATATQHLPDVPVRIPDDGFEVSF